MFTCLRCRRRTLYLCSFCKVGWCSIRAQFCLHLPRLQGSRRFGLTRLSGKFFAQNRVIINFDEALALGSYNKKNIAFK